MCAVHTPTPIPHTDDDQPQPPCPGCGAKTYDPGPCFALFGLCRFCFDDDDQRIDQELLRREKALPVPPKACAAEPGSALKIEVLVWRESNGFALFHPDDAYIDCGQGVEPEADPVPPDLIIAGIEVDRSRAVVAYRARPWWRGCRVKLGRFMDYEEAYKAVRDYFIERLGEFQQFRTTWNRHPKPACVAVVKTAEGWCDLEWPKFAPRAIAKRAAARVVKLKFKTEKDCRAAFRKAILSHLKGR